MPSIDFNPRSRWPFSAFFSSSPVTISAPSPPPNCSCNFLGGHSEETHSHGQSFWHQCHPRAAGFAPPSPQLSQRTHLAGPGAVDIAQQGTLSVSDNKSGATISDTQKSSDGGKTRTSEYLESGFFNKDESIFRPTTPEAPDNLNGSGKAGQAASIKGSIVDSNPNTKSMPAVESSNPVTPPNKVWRRASTSKIATTETNGNLTWRHRSTRPLDKPWRRDSVPEVGYSSLKSRAAGDRTGYMPSTKGKTVSATSPSDDMTEPERKTPTVLGCSQCLSEPKLKVSPCGCLICLTCGGRYWGAGPSGSDVYCGCGEVHSSIRDFCFGIRHSHPSGSLFHDQFRCHKGQYCPSGL